MKKLISLSLLCNLCLTSYAQQLKPSSYSELIKLFPPIAVGDTIELESHARLEQNELTQSAFNFDSQEVYAVGSIEDYRGFDLLTIRSLDTDNYWAADTYASYIDWLFVFRQGKLLSFDFILGTNTSGEGGDYNQTYQWNADTTLTLSSDASERWSATGYDLPIDSKRKDEYRIGDNGTLYHTKTHDLAFTSAFFVLNELNGAEKLRYPARENDWTLFSDDRLSLSFYVDKTEKGAYCTHIITRNQTNQVLDVFSIVPNNDTPVDPPQKQASPIRSAPPDSVKYPIIIHTPTATIELQSDGLFK